MKKNVSLTNKLNTGKDPAHGAHMDVARGSKTQTNQTWLPSDQSRGFRQLGENHAAFAKQRTEENDRTMKYFTPQKKR